MGKSIRSKVKRMHRAEFRKTIGRDAAQRNMDVIQSKLRECVQKGSMNSFQRLSNLLDTTTPTSSSSSSSGGGGGGGAMHVDVDADVNVNVTFPSQVDAKVQANVNAVPVRSTPLGIPEHKASEKRVVKTKKYKSKYIRIKPSSQQQQQRQQQQRKEKKSKPK